MNKIAKWCSNVGKTLPLMMNFTPNLWSYAWIDERIAGCLSNFEAPNKISVQNQYSSIEKCLCVWEREREREREIGYEPIFGQWGEWRSCLPSYSFRRTQNDLIKHVFDKRMLQCAYMVWSYTGKGPSLSVFALDLVLLVVESVEWEIRRRCTWNKTKKKR